MKKKFKPEDIKIVWFGTEVPDDVEAAEAQICKELYELMIDGDMKISDLLFHTVFLSNDMENDVVTVSPLKAKNTVECIYNKKPVWETLTVNDDEKVSMITHDDRDNSTKH